ncbi:SoxR reducing system RseC family protein [Pseudothauera rhizosphaerae]|uniref:Positive regulator of sigma(E), RseC/MucC n=1 Tax=Pseudothauera rhizosphaerae TaxID=2565932 RepID=A0A4S4AKC9_9RHOO|nr:SoxR reducing system RseC family protein [Pseudothauera rhizosphaerae]THF59364.1 hypothetical protein E6O51_15335 [Pseudothauera rhizosphaerae]
MSAAPMIARSGRIVQVGEDRLTVRFERPSACGSCRSANVCAGNTPANELVLARPPGRDYRTGDTVQVGVAEDAALRATAAAYLVPLAGFVLAMLAAAAFGLPDGAVLAASLAGLGAGLLALRRIARRPALQLQPALLDAGEPHLHEEIHP